MDRSEVALLCILDLSKCFDVIDHTKLLTKLELHGIDTDWFKAYLGGHTQAVSISDQRGNRHLSSFLPNNIGVFQGSSLGPLLYCIFSNDLSLHVPVAHVTQFADDTQVLISGRKSDLPNLINQMETCLNQLYDYFMDNGLKVNPTKTQLLTFGSRQNLRNIAPIRVCFRDAVIDESHSCRKLGVTFDRHMSWDSHVAVVVRKCTGFLLALSHLRHHLPTSTLFTIVNSLVISNIRYCISVYGNGSAANIHRLDKIINFATRVVSGLRKFDHISDARNELGLLTAADLHLFHSLTLLHKIILTGEPTHIAGQISANSTLRNRHTRADDHLHLPAIHREAGRRRFLYSSVFHYNKLPTETKTLKLSNFKKRVRAYLHEQH